MSAGVSDIKWQLQRDNSQQLQELLAAIQYLTDELSPAWQDQVEARFFP